MSGRFILRRESRKFCDWLTDLLNGTVCNNVRLEFMCIQATGQVRISTGGAVPIRIGARKPTGYLNLTYYLDVEHSGRFLMVQSSFVEITRDPDGREPLLHYDYERNKTGGYPEAHVQIHATSGPWERFAPRRLHKLHLPTGGRRFRPTLEDLIEFLITENLAEGRPGWETLVEEGRCDYREVQTKALVRTSPIVASAALQELEDSV